MGEPLGFVSVRIADTEFFQEILGVLKDVIDDERIDKSIREEYTQKLLVVTEANESERK